MAIEMQLMYVCLGNIHFPDYNDASSMFTVIRT